MSLNEFEELLERYYAGKCTPEEEEWVSRWLTESSLDQSNPWYDLSETQKQRYIDQLYTDITQTTAAVSIDEPQPLEPRRNRRLVWLGGVAASVCLLLAAYLFIPRDDAADEAAQTWTSFVSADGERKELQLTDGTTIWLQGGSELSYPEKFSSSRRVVRLDGEAYFDVSHQPDWPFVVSAGDLETEVLGTAFNIEAFSKLDNMVVSLIEGQVAVRIRDRTGEQHGADIVLSPMEAAVFSVASNELVKSDLPVFGSADDFKVGSLQFDETPMDEVLFRLGTAYGVEISYDEEQASRHRITGDFVTSEPIDDVFRSIARSTGATYNRDGRSITLTF